MVRIPKNYKGYKVKVDNKMKWFGEEDDKKKLIRINKKKSLKKGGKKELLDTWLHEKAHVLHPKMKEKNIIRTLRKKMEKNIKKHKSHIYNINKTLK
jgi:hypothetical protein